MKLNFEGKNKVEVAIARIQQFEPPAGYYLADSGGKDSDIIYDLSCKARAKFDAHYHTTCADPPELVQFVRTVGRAQIERPPESLWRLIEKNGLPLRQARWCCRLLKERGGSGRVVLTGVRWAESKGKTRRAKRKMVDTCFTDPTKTFVNPIIDWTDAEVWQYHKAEHLAYCSLYDEPNIKRLGCVLCPMTRNVQQHIARWPKTAEAWYRAACKYHARATNPIGTPDDYWAWWLTRKGQGKISEYQTTFL